MKELLSIGEFAKLRGITTETLRHYHRIGLVEPFKIDLDTGYRYYSILQYEKLGTIKELRQLGMSIDEIMQYFNNRNAAQSVDILRVKRDELQKTILEMVTLEKSITGKIEDMDEILKMADLADLEEMVFKKLDPRKIITFNRTIETAVDLSYAGVELEKMLKEVAPIVASNRYGAIRTFDDKVKDGSGDQAVLFLVIKDSEHIDPKHIINISGGLHACMYYSGELLWIENKLEQMKCYIEKEGYRISGQVLQIVQVDSSITDRLEEILIEIQIPVEKA